MPIPLKPGENIYVERKCRPGDYAMPSMQAAFDHYSIALNICGDRKYFSHEHVYIMHSGDVSLGKINVYHRNLPMSDLPYDRFLIKYRKEVLQPVIDIIGENEFDHIYDLHVCRYTKEMQEILFAQFQSMLEEYEHKTVYSDLLLQGMLQKLFITIYENRLREEDEETINLTTYDERIHAALFYIESHLEDTLSLSEVSGYVSLSPTYFSRLFKQTTGCSFSEYVNNIRVQHAQILLGKTTLSIGEIAAKVGFSNGNYLCNVFKERYHISPTEFRKGTKE